MRFLDSLLRRAMLVVITRTVECGEWLHAHDMGAAMLRDAGPNVQNDRECVMVAVKRHGESLQFAAAFADDKDVVLAAV